MQMCCCINLYQDVNKILTIQTYRIQKILEQKVQTTERVLVNRTRLVFKPPSIALSSSINPYHIPVHSYSEQMETPLESID